MDLLAIRRIFKAGFLDFWRNGFVSFASVLVMTITLFILGMIVFTGVILNTTLQQLRNQADVSVYIVPNTPPDQITQLQQTIQALPEVASVDYISQDDELVQFRQRHQNDQLTLQALDELGGNPLGAVLTIKAKDISQYDAIAQFLQQQQQTPPTGQTSIIDKIDYFDAQHQQALTRLQQITSAAQELGVVIIAILALTTIAICFNTLRLAIYSSREEIGVMRLVGATQAYIRAPFLVEGMLFGVIAGVITLLIFYPLTYWLGNATENFFGGINVFSYYLSNFGFFFLGIIGTGIVLGVVASYLAVRRYLRV